MLIAVPAMSRRSVRAAAFSAAALGMAPAAAQQAGEDPLRTVFREAARQSDLGNGFQALSTFSVAPGITAAAYDVDTDGAGERFKLNSYKISPSYTFDPVYGPVSPYVEVSLGFLQADEVDNFALLNTLVETDFTTYSGLAGAGVEVELTDDFTLRPIFLLGYSHTSEDNEAYGPNAERVLAAGQGIVFDARVNSLLVGGALQLGYDHSFAGPDINAAANVRYNFLHDNVINASDPVLETSGNFSVFTARVEVDGPIGLSVFSHDLRWIGFGSNTWLPGDQNEALGFAYFFEVGGGVELVDPTVISGIEGVSLRASAIVGDNVTGWTAGASIEF